MSIKYAERELEIYRLGLVLKETKKQINKLKTSVKSRKEAIIKTRKEGWEKLPHRIWDDEDWIELSQFNRELEAIQRDYTFGLEKLKRLEKIYSSPYFGRVDFCEDGLSNTEEIYIGIFGLCNEETGETIVYDWRAPICSIFYDYEPGDAKYRTEKGEVKGVITLKRQYKILNGKHEYMFDTNLIVRDETLQEILSKTRDGRMKNIVNTIQREQNKAIRDNTHSLLVVEGPAGSGKTSIALHRAAFLLYQYRNTLKPEDILIFSPNEVFSDYISNVLPELGEENIQQTSFIKYAEKYLNKFGNIEDFGRQMEYLLSNMRKTGYAIRGKGIEYKTSKPFFQVVNNYICFLENEGQLSFGDLIYREQLIASEKEISELFFDKFKYLPYYKRLDKIKRRLLYLLDPHRIKRLHDIEEELNKNTEHIFVSNEELQEESLKVLNKEMTEIYNTVNRWTYYNLFDLYLKLFTDDTLFNMLSAGTIIPENISFIREQTEIGLEQKKIGYEDIGPLLYLKSKLEGFSHTIKPKHIILDEAQDYSIFQYNVIKDLFPESKLTILGDQNQSIHPYMSFNSLKDLTLTIGKPAHIQLTKTYRSTEEITQFSKALLSNQHTFETVRKPGIKPKIIKLPAGKELIDRIAKDIIHLEKSCKSIAIVGRTFKESEEIHKAFKGKYPLISEDEKIFTRGIIVIPSYLIKGLEFDAVIIYNAGNGNYSHKNERYLLFTVCTRALHILHIYYSENLSPLLNIDYNLYESI